MACDDVKCCDSSTDTLSVPEWQFYGGWPACPQCGQPVKKCPQCGQDRPVSPEPRDPQPWDPAYWPPFTSDPQWVTYCYEITTTDVCNDAPSICR